MKINNKQLGLGAIHFSAISIFLAFFLMGCAHTAAPTVTQSTLDQTAPASNISQPSEQQTQISKLDFLLGNWAGGGISYANDGTQTPYFDTEYVRFDLDQNLLLINAKGERGGATTYQLHTVIYYDVDAKHYWYTPFSAQGSRRFACTLKTQQSGRPQFICFNEAKDYRLTFQRMQDGKWNEFGERLKDGEWRKNFETILSPATGQ